MIPVVCSDCAWEGMRAEDCLGTACPRCGKTTLRADRSGNIRTATHAERIALLLVNELGARSMYSVGQQAPDVDVYVLPDKRLVLVHTYRSGDVEVYVPVVECRKLGTYAGAEVAERALRAYAAELKE